MTFRVVIDGANLCKPNESLPWKLDFLESAMRDVTQAAGSADPKRKLELKVYVDAKIYYRFTNERDKDRFEELCQEGKIERTPAGGGADLYILKWALDHEALIVTNDQYKEFQDQHTWLKDSGRSVSAVYDASLRKWNFMERFAGKDTPRDIVGVLSAQKTFTGVPTGPAAAATTTTTTAAAPTAAAAATPAAAAATTTTTTTTTAAAAVGAVGAVGAYTARVTRKAPAAMILLVDQSGSMGDVWSGGGGTKSVGVAESINNLLEALVFRSMMNRGDIYPYFDVAVLGYGGNGKNAVRSLLPDTTLVDPIRSIDKISAHAKVEKSTRNGIAEERNVWVNPHNNGGTPMCEAIINATRILAPWVKAHADSFPPIVMNVTDGISTDGPPQIPARDLLSLKTNDGSVLFFNINIAGLSDEGRGSGGASPTPQPTKPNPLAPSGARKILFPNESVQLPNEAARSLFDMSSVIPNQLRKSAESLEIVLAVGARGFAYNATSTDLTRFFDVGTPPNTQQ